MKTIKRDVRKTATYPHPIERVWEAITDSEALAAWLMPNDFAPVLGHEFTYRTEPRPGFDGVVRCTITELDPPRRLAYTWRGGPLDTLLTFTLEPVPGGTRLHVEHTGFAGLRAVMVSAILDRGWAVMYRERLPAVLDRLAGGEPPAPTGKPPGRAERIIHGAASRLGRRVEDLYAKVIARLPDR